VACHEETTTKQGELIMGRGFYSSRQPNAFDVRAREVLNGEQRTTFESAEDLLEHGSLEDLKKAANKLALSDREKADAERSARDGDVFCKLHGEFFDTAENARILRAHCMSAFGTAYPTLEQFEVGYQALRANNLLDIDKAELARQADAATTARANVVREEAFNEKTAYGLDLAEVRRRANSVMNR
jgi:hypothetical protein